LLAKKLVMIAVIRSICKNQKHRIIGSRSDFWTQTGAKLRASTACTTSGTGTFFGQWEGAELKYIYKSSFWLKITKHLLH